MREPLKWAKYLKLVDVGLLNRASLVAEIRRYPGRRREGLVADIRRSLARDSFQNDLALYVVKLVPEQEHAQLPNFRLSKLNEVRSLMRFLESADWNRFCEAWWCRTPIDQKVFSVAGRLLITQDPSSGQIVEQVWRYSPRIIEGLRESSSYTFVRAARPSWGWSYSINSLHLGVEPERSRRRIVSEFRSTMQRLEEMREGLEVLSGEFEAAGLHDYSFEYKMVGSEFRIIDWDTPDDRRILHA